MHKLAKRILPGIGVVFVVLLVVIAWARHPRQMNVRSEYITAGVIHDIHVYVSSHPGEWPKSWNVLGSGADYSSHTIVRFDLSVEELRERPELIYSAVMPVSGRYYTYPHAKKQLEEIMKTIHETKNAIPQQKKL